MLNCYIMTDVSVLRLVAEKLSQ